MFSRGHPVGVHRLDMLGVRLTPPSDHETLGDRAGPVDLLLRDGGLTEAAGRLRDEGQRHHRRPGKVVARLGVGDVDELTEPPVGSQHRQRALHVHPDVAGVHRQRERFRRRQTGLERGVDEQPPHVAVIHLADEIFDVDAAIP